MSGSASQNMPTVEVILPVSYVCVDGDGEELGEGMGQTIKISQNGIVIETVTPINSDYIYLMIVDYNNDLRQIKGKVGQTNNSAQGMYRTNVHFMGSKQEIVKTLKLVVQTYHYQKYK